MTVHRYQLPRMIVRGVATTLDISITNDAGTAITPTTAVLSLYAGGKTILDAVSATAADPSTYALLAATTTDEAYSTEWLEVWTLTHSSGTVETFQRPAYLVRRALFPTITDTDLERHHTDLSTHMLDPDKSDFSDQRDEAWVWLNRELIKQGRRPNLVIDSWALRDVHIYKTLEIIFRDAGQSLGDGRWVDLAELYGQRAESELSTINLQYDDDEDGFVDEGDQLAARPVLFLN